MAASHGFDAAGTGVTEAKAGVYQSGGGKANGGAASPSCLLGSSGAHCYCAYMDAEQQTPPKGASLEDRAANALNAVMIMLLSAAAAVLGASLSFIHFRRAFVRGLDFGWPEIMPAGLILNGLGLFVLACFGMRFGYRMLFRSDR